MSMQTIWNWYSRESVQKALLEVAQNREVVSVFRDGSFGKRPDMLQYPADIIQAIAEGTVAFHGSLERWSQPMKLDVGMTKQDLDSLRIGWDILLDPDVPDFEIAKITTKQIIEAFKDHGIKNYSVKFTGGKGFHIGISFESLPEKINFQSTNLLYPELLQKIICYIKWYIRDQLKDELLSLDTPVNLSQRIGKNLTEITSEDGIEPFKIISMDIFSSRHLFRLPYSLHESSLLVSLPINPKYIDKFEKEDARPEKAKVEEKFLVPKATGDAEALVIETLDWAEKYFVEVKEELPKPKTFVRVREIPEPYFPPCIKKILEGLSDGRKRATFILTNFLRNMGWSGEKIEKRLYEWNEKNYPSLRSNFLRGQLRWHFRQTRNLLPPRCDNETFYKAIGVCIPDAICKGGTEEITIKNPINYPFRKLKGTNKLKIRKKL